MAKVKVSRFRRISNWLHLWLGLISGVVVFVVCFTAAIWTFEAELMYYFSPGQQVDAQEVEPLKPSILIDSARKYLEHIPGDRLGMLYDVYYRKPAQSVIVSYTDTVGGRYKRLYLNPYSGEVLYRWAEDTGVYAFLDFLRSGHRFFWLPRKIGSPFVGASCIIFLITLITGLVWWYPKKWNRSIREKSFKIKWGANWKRLNIDLHNVLGFYSILVALILTVTGISVSFRWFSDGYYAALTGGKEKRIYPKKGESDTTATALLYAHPEDELWRRYKQYGRIFISFPKDSTDVFIVNIKPSGHNELIEWYGFDQYTLKLAGGTINEAALSLGQKIYYKNYEIHTGAIAGLPTKIIASLASLIGASLPVTGYIIWYNRKWGTKRKKRIR